MSEKPLNCPFCGAEPEKYRYREPRSYISTDDRGINHTRTFMEVVGFTMLCPDCLTNGPICDDYPAAISAWNRRTAGPDSQKDEAAIKTFDSQYNGGEYWKPPLGKAPDFDKLDEARDYARHLKRQRDRLARGLVEVCDIVASLKVKVCPDFTCKFMDYSGCAAKESKRKTCWLKFAKRAGEGNDD